VAQEEQQHVALPKLLGQPAYARPPRLVAEAPRPLDPDDLPLEAFMNDAELQLAANLPGRPYGGIASNGHGPQQGTSNGTLRPRKFRIRSLAGRLLGGHH
jgi:hypothetical protein